MNPALLTLSVMCRPSHVWYSRNIKKIMVNIHTLNKWYLKTSTSTVGLRNVKCLVLLLFDTIPKLAEPFEEWHNKEDCKWCTPWQSTETTSRHFLLLKSHRVLWYMCKYNLIYMCKKITTFLAPIFTKFTSQQHYPQISNSKFHPNWTIREESIHRNPPMPPDEVRLSVSYFHTTHSHSTNFVEICSKFYPNLIHIVTLCLKWSCGSQGA